MDRRWSRFRDAAAAGRGRADLGNLERRLAHTMMLENVLWLAVLVLMVFPLGQR